MLTCLQLKKFFGGVKAVDGCSFKIKPKTITALIGPNGAGKSTVFNLISGILRPDTGSIFFRDEDISTMKPDKISNLGISRIFQKSTLFSNLTVKENLTLALDSQDTKFWRSIFAKRKITEPQIRETLKMVSMQDFEDYLARDLSFGQKRLVELARAILNPHKFLMLDEPVAGVNPKLRQDIAKILLQLKNRGETILLIEHDMGFTLEISDTVIVLDQGKVIAQGTPEQIKNNPQVLEAYLGE